MFVRKLKLGVPVAVAAVFAVALPASAQTSLVDGFKEPPNIARPRVYWYWQNGNITKEGLTKDLEWMHRAGIGGVETFDVAVATPNVVEPRLLYMQPGWKDAFHHALQVADRLGMKTTIGAAPGWSQTGGPWVKPADAMKKFVWTETAVAGGKRVPGALPKPPEVNGPFGDQPRGARAGVILPTLYKDQMVIAFRMPASESALEHAHPTVTSSGGSFTYADLATRTYANPMDLPAAAGKPAWIQIGFDAPQKVRGVTVATLGAGGRGGGGGGGFGGGAPMESLEASGDGVNFTKVIDLAGGGVYQRTFAFAPVTGRYFRLRFSSLNATTFRICRFQLHAAMPVNRFELKAAFAAVPDYYEIATPQADELNVVKKTDVIDLTGKMGADGTLDWTAPAGGDWMVLRIGYSLTGATNAPAPTEATGYEVDKLRKGATKTFMDDYLKLYADASGGMMGEHGVNNVATDSWEAGFQNWTDGILADFKRLRGYDPTPWVPALTGRVVQSSDASDRFLWDFRRTIADLVISSNFDQVRDSLHERGLKYVTEAMAASRATIGDAMEMKARADFPMGEFWLPYQDFRTRNYVADLRDTAAVAHIYGKLATAESITSTGIPYAYGPWDEKLTADEILLDGINQMTLHVSVHQPNDNAPGLALGQFGMWFNRLETWAEQARAWTDYIARSCYLLQQGRAVIDVAYFYGEEGPAPVINQSHAPEITDGYNYDFVNKESLLNEFSAEGGKLVTKSGMKYRLLYLGGTSNRMTLPVLQKVRALMAAGAVVVGLPPVDSPSLSDDMTRWNAVAREIWPDKSLVRKVGLGKIYQTMNLSQVLAAEAIPPDFAYIKPFTDAVVRFYHRVDGNTDIYFVSNRTDNAMTINADFRVTGRAAEVWMADRGTIRPASYRIHDGITTVPLALESRDAVFVVFREPSAATARTVAAPVRFRLLDVSGPWEVKFQPGRGAPGSATFDALSDWSNNANPGIKYFSGTATYTKTIEISESALSQKPRIELDLGKVHEVAEVAVNGKTAGIAWKPPYQVDITDAVKAGANLLSIKVVNLWPNRLIGDQQPGAEKVTFAPNSTYRANSPLMPSGLIGPVQVMALAEIK